MADTLESRLTLDLTDRIVRSPAFKHALTQVLSSPELRAALTGQSMSFAEELVASLNQRLRRLDDAIERRPRRWFHRPPRPQVVPGGSVRLPYAGLATRGVALAVDAALVTMIFLTGTAAELTPVREIDDIEIGPPGDITRALQREFDDALHGRSERYREWLDVVPVPSKA